MESINLFVVSITAFFTVFLVLSVVAVFMRLIIKVFPEKEVEEDVAIYAAIASVANSTYPGTKVTKIEEMK